jgi:hypothetical protein
MRSSCKRLMRICSARDGSGTTTDLRRRPRCARLVEDCEERTAAAADLACSAAARWSRAAWMTGARDAATSDRQPQWQSTRQAPDGDVFRTSQWAFFRIQSLAPSGPVARNLPPPRDSSSVHGTTRSPSVPAQAAARRAGLEGVEKRLPAPSTARTRRSGTPACFAHAPHRRIAGRAGYRS